MSTSITTSLLQYELDSKAMNLESYTSMDNITRSYELGIKALDEIEEFINEHGNTCDFKRVDSFLYTAKDIEKKKLKKSIRLERETD